MSVLLITSTSGLAFAPQLQASFAAFPGENGKIVFTSDIHDKFSEIYTMNADGSEVTRLTRNVDSEFSPSFSPDGAKIVFMGQHGYFPEIYTMNADGTGLLRLTDNTAIDFDPVFSSDGTTIAFVTDRDGNNEIYIMNIDGTGQTRITNNSVHDNAPSFSQDGTKITFMSYIDENFQPYVMNADGTGRAKLTNATGDWIGGSSSSPDGTKIVFASDNEIYTKNLDGTGVMRLTNNAFNDQMPSWGPKQATPEHPTLSVKSVDISGNPVSGMWAEVRTLDDKVLQSGFTPFVFTGNADAEYKVTVSNFEGRLFEHWDNDNTDKTRVVKLTANVTVTASFDVSGALTDFTSLPYRDYKMLFGRASYIEPLPSGGLYVANGDGTMEVRLDTDFDVGAASWSPDGTKILFSSNKDDADGSQRTSLYVMSANGSNVRRLTSGALISDGASAWSPDGMKIAFSRTTFSQQGSVTKICVLDIDSGAIRVLAGSGLRDYMSGWSPDGTKIVFTAQEITWPGSHVFVMNADGTNATRVTPDPTDELYLHSGPSWSPDGKKIASGSPIGLALVNPDGTGFHILEGTEKPGGLSWTPDSKRIIFSKYDTYGTDSHDLYIINADGTGLEPLIVSRGISEGAPQFVRTLGNNISINEPRLEAIADSAEELAAGLASADAKFLGPIPPEIGNRKVAFLMSNAPEPSVWVINMDGSGRKKLTEDGFRGDEPNWSPDGTGLAFVSGRDGNSEIYVMNADGTGLTNVTDNNAIDHEYSWSPDSTKIAFVSERDGNAEIYVMNADGDNVRRLTHDSYLDTHLKWSPDGTKIAFTRYNATDLGVSGGTVGVVNADGSNLTMLAGAGGQDARPSWSPDGSKIAFDSYNNKIINGIYLGSEIFIMNANGTDARQLTSPSQGLQSVSYFPLWSPSEDKILFATRGGIATINADGSNLKILVHSEWSGAPSWSPDGSQIVFTGPEGNYTRESGPHNFGHFIINPDGSGMQKFLDEGDPLLQKWNVEIGPLVAGASEPPARPEYKDLFCGRPADDYDSVINGTDSADILNGTENDDLIRGLGGNDTIFGGAGDDCLEGGDGSDAIWGGDGEDMLLGNEGDDKIIGDLGDDVLNGHEGSDKIWGGDGGDAMLGEAGDDLMIGDGGNDTMWGSNGNDRILGEEGSDIIYGGSGDDRLQGHSGDDRLQGGSDNDRIIGYGGMDVLIGDGGSDNIWGNTGDDTLYDDEGDDSHNGGDGRDTCSDIVGKNAIIECFP